MPSERLDAVLPVVGNYTESTRFEDLRCHVNRYIGAHVYFSLPVIAASPASVVLS
jgi:hypothetical protein